MLCRVLILSNDGLEVHVVLCCGGAIERSSATNAFENLCSLGPNVLCMLRNDYDTPLAQAAASEFTHSVE